MLQALTEEQKEWVKEKLTETSCHVGQIYEYGIEIDGCLDFNTMTEIVDYLRAATPQLELFEECWTAYNRKGSKKKSIDQWKKLTDAEKKLALQHIKIYVNSRERKYQKDFERYLRDRTFKDVVLNGNDIVYDPMQNQEQDVNEQTNVVINGQVYR